MKLVVDNEQIAKDVLLEESKQIIASWRNNYNNICQGLPLKAGSFWNYEILEFYIEISQLKLQLYNFREFDADQYILIKKRSSMESKEEDFKAISVIELLSRHKILIKYFVDKTNVSEKLPVEELLDNTNFDFLILMLKILALPTM